MGDKLRDLAKTIRSKNAGVDHVTLDVIFHDRRTFERVRDSGVLNAGTVGRLFGVDGCEKPRIFGEQCPQAR